MKKLNKFIFIFISMFMIGMINVNASAKEEIFNIGSNEDRIGEAFAVTENLIFFTYDDGTNGMELWVTDGTTIGTHLVKDITLGIDGSNITKLKSFNNKVYFTIGDNNLWVSDGTELGTYIVKEMNYSISNIETINNKLLFNLSGYNGKPYAIFVSDGTEAGTTELVISDDVNIGMYMMDISLGTRTDDYLYFTGFSKTYSAIIWRTDGTVDGTSVVWANSNLYMSSNIYPYGDQIIVGGIYDSETGTEPWITDNTESGGHLIKNIVPGTDSSNPQNFIEYNGKIYFTAIISGFSRFFVTDGTEAGTYMFAGDEENILWANSPVIYRNILYYDLRSLGEQDEHGASTIFSSLSKTNGTVEGTQTILGTEYTINKIMSFPNGLYFSGGYNDSNYSLFITDGTLNNASSITNKLISPNNDNGITNPIYFNGNLYYMEADKAVDESYDYTNIRLIKYTSDVTLVDNEEETPDPEEETTEENTNTNTNTTHTTTTGTKTSNNYNDEEIIPEEEISSEEPIEEISNEEPVISNEEEISSEQEPIAEEQTNNIVYYIIGGVTLAVLITIIVLVSKKMKSM